MHDGDEDIAPLQLSFDFSGPFFAAFDSPIEEEMSVAKTEAQGIDNAFDDVGGFLLPVADEYPRHSFRLGKGGLKGKLISR